MLSLETYSFFKDTFLLKDDIQSLTGTCGHTLSSWLVPVTWRLRTTTGPLVTGQRVESTKTMAAAHYDSPCYGHTLTHAPCG